MVGLGLVMAEAARVDCGVSTFILAHGSLAMATLQHLGSEKHKRELLPGGTQAHKHAQPGTHSQYQKPLLKQACALHCRS